MIRRKNNLAAGPELWSQVGNGGEAQAQWLVSQLIPPMRSKCATLGEWEGGREEATEEGREEARNMCHTHTQDECSDNAEGCVSFLLPIYPNGALNSSSPSSAVASVVAVEPSRMEQHARSQQRQRSETTVS